MKLSNSDQKARDYYNKYYSQLVGATITSAGVVAEDDFGQAAFWPTFHITMPDGSKFAIEVSQDPEGNGPGFLFGLPTPQ